MVLSDELLESARSGQAIRIAAWWSESRKQGAPQYLSLKMSRDRTEKEKAEWYRQKEEERTHGKEKLEPSREPVQQDLETEKGKGGGDFSNDIPF
jgi:hypothetical protein